MVTGVMACGSQKWTPEQLYGKRTVRTKRLRVTRKKRSQVVAAEVVKYVEDRGDNKVQTIVRL